MELGAESPIAGQVPLNRQIFSAGEIAHFPKVSPDEIDYWVRAKLLTPSVRPAIGHGSRRLFDISDIKQGLLILRLRMAKWKPKQIAKAIRAISVALTNPDTIDTPVLIHDGKSLLILCRRRGKEPLLLDAASPWQYVMVIALDALDEETRLRMARSK
jgi:DNA-binding transcriptional MerR regulator